MLLFLNTVDQKFFAGKIFYRLNFRLVLFSSGFVFVTMTTRWNKLTPFIRPKKYFTCLIFIVEGDRWEFFMTNISQSTVVPLFCADLSVMITAACFVFRFSQRAPVAGLVYVMGIVLIQLVYFILAWWRPAKVWKQHSKCLLMLPHCHFFCFFSSLFPVLFFFSCSYSSLTEPLTYAHTNWIRVPPTINGTLFSGSFFQLMMDLYTGNCHFCDLAISDHVVVYTPPFS